MRAERQFWIGHLRAARKQPRRAIGKEVLGAGIDLRACVGLLVDLCKESPESERVAGTRARLDRALALGHVGPTMYRETVEVLEALAVAWHADPRRMIDCDGADWITLPHGGHMRRTHRDGELVDDY